MKARDLMTTSVVAVPPEAPVQRIAQLLLDHGISAVPVVDGHVPVGVVSEGDIVARCGRAGHSRRHWCVRILAGDGKPTGDLMGELERRRIAREVMTTPVITTAEDVEAAEISRLMLTHRIKRLPVVRSGKLVGILSRADLLRAVAAAGNGLDARSARVSALGHVLRRLDETFHAGHNGRHPAEASRSDVPHALTAAELRASVAHHKEHEAHARAEQRRLARERSAHEVDFVLNTHLSEDSWRHMLLDARHAADRGDTEIQLLRIPRETCTDNGRAINMCEPGWASTLRGEAAEVWLRWSRELRDRGFRLAARTLEYPDGVPGDIGLFLVWGE